VAFHAEGFPNAQYPDLASLARRQVSRFQVSAWTVDAEFTSARKSPVICREHFAPDRAGKAAVHAVLWSCRSARLLCL